MLEDSFEEGWPYLQDFSMMVHPSWSGSESGDEVEQTPVPSLQEREPKGIKVYAGKKNIF